MIHLTRSTWQQSMRLWNINGLFCTNKTDDKLFRDFSVGSQLPFTCRWISAFLFQYVCTWNNWCKPQVDSDYGKSANSFIFQKENFLLVCFNIFSLCSSENYIQNVVVLFQTIPNSSHPLTAHFPVLKQNSSFSLLPCLIRRNVLT